MRRLGVLALLAATTLGSGCGLLVTATRNICNEPRLAIEEHQQRRRANALAKEAWKLKPVCTPESSRDFRDGYLDGYSDYLVSGGTTDPPPAPPKRYLRVTYQTPASLRAIEDYFVGFHAGAVDALHGGQRKLMVVPVVLPANPEPVPIPFAIPSAEALPKPWELHGVKPGAG